MKFRNQMIFGMQTYTKQINNQFIIVFFSCKHKQTIIKTVQNLIIVTNNIYLQLKGSKAKVTNVTYINNILLVTFCL